MTMLLYWFKEKFHLHIEYLLRMKEAGIPCPIVVSLKKHVLVMSFIGDQMAPAPKLKDIDLPFADMTIIYDQTVDVSYITAVVLFHYLVFCME